MDRWDRTAFNDLRKGLALGIIQQGEFSRRLPVDESIGTLGIEPRHPVANDLQRRSADTRGIAATTTMINFRQCQQPPSLVRAPCRTRQSSQAHRIKVIPPPIASPMAMPSNRQP